MYCVLLRWFSTMAFACLVAATAAAEDVKSQAVTYSPWTKFCLGDTCFIGRDGRSNVIGREGRSTVDCGPVVTAVLIERNGDTKKTLRVTLPTRVSFERGVRITIDQGLAIERPYAECFANGCMADYVAGAELVDQLKQGRTLVLEAAAKDNTPITRTIPLTDFANAYDGPSREEPKVYEKVFSSKEEMQAELERERRAEEERNARCRAR